MKKLVKRKAAGKTIELPEREEPEERADPMQAIKQSLGRRPMTVRRSHGTPASCGGASAEAARTAPGRVRRATQLRL